MLVNDHGSFDTLGSIDMEVACSELGVALNAELDRIGYPAAPARTGFVAEMLSTDRTSAYRILKGLTQPSLDNLLRLRHIGVSIDRLLDAANQRKLEILDFRFHGAKFSATVHKLPSLENAIFVAWPTKEGYFGLDIIQPGQSFHEGSFGVDSLTFPSMPAIAVLDDDANILDSISDGLSANFRVVTFSYGKELLRFNGGLSSFRALLIDWNLPDFKGPDLIQQLRGITNAPIFILTGDQSSDEGISRALQLGNVHYVQKPVSFNVLTRRVLDAIGL
jgi:CheY-like chemotaxis protein